ncbi:IS110 family transposase [Kineosporia sp. NBRC 101677]|uniref:IS110 family transposase n=1 Tax=Kineosporia sp. NBRC 101677 TaxID=3032197 RepID=UPI0024A0ECD3|nr:IS110 family transposase [Kineosporia sp. NBRC 101677]GLY20253.1 IS110 family transposase [Kineosporia sp. NBRC 101677]
MTSAPSQTQRRVIEPGIELEQARVVGGADTHADTIHVAVIDFLGKDVADAEFPATGPGYAAAIAFLTGHGIVEQVGIEGTSSYGAGLALALAAAGLGVVEVNRPDRAERRARGKSDPIDAYQAARAVLSGRASSAPKNPATETVRSLHNARRSAIKARTATINQIHGMLVTAPEDLRAKYRDLKEKTLITTLARSRPGIGTDHTGDHAVRVSVATALKLLAQRYEFLAEQDKTLTAAIDEYVSAANPALRAAHGVGPDTAAQLLITAGNNPERLRSEASFAALCGAAPVPVSSGKTRGRYRLSRGGDRAANNALYRIAMVRWSSHAPTRAYVARHKAAGRTGKEILRMLKRAIAREIYRYLTQQIEIADYSDLRPSRQAKNITLTAAAQHFGLWPTAISRLERGLQRDDDLADRYRTWLTTA